MVAGGFSQQELEKQLSQLKDSADGIQSLSSWCLKHRHQHRRIVTSWLKILKRAKIQQRLTLFYLANDVVQHSKRKNLDFVGSFQLVLEAAMPLVRDEKLRPSISRILKIWRERAVFPEPFIVTLTNIVTNVGKADSEENAKLLSDFQPADLIDMLRQMESVGRSTDSRLSDVKKSGEIQVTDATIVDIRANVKSRAHSAAFIGQLESSVQVVERYVAALDSEIQLRADLIERLERSELYYETQRADAKVVAVAYKNFGRRVRELQKRLTERLECLDAPSPLPSPPAVDDAPSPTGSCEELFSLPETHNSTSSLSENSAAVGNSGDVSDAVATSAVNTSVDVRSEIGRLIGKWTAGGDDSPDAMDITPPTVSPPSPSPSPPLNGCGDSTIAGYHADSNFNRELSSVRLSDLIPGLREQCSPSPQLFANSSIGSRDGDDDDCGPSDLFPGPAPNVDVRLLNARLLGHSVSPPPVANVSGVVSGAAEASSALNNAASHDDDDDDVDYERDSSRLTNLVRMVDAKLQAHQPESGRKCDAKTPATLVTGSDIRAVSVLPPLSDSPYSSRTGTGAVRASSVVAIPGLDLSRPPPPFSAPSWTHTPPPPLPHGGVPPRQSGALIPSPAPSVLLQQPPLPPIPGAVPESTVPSENPQRSLWDRSVDEFISQISGERRNKPAPVLNDKFSGNDSSGSDGASSNRRCERSSRDSRSNERADNLEAKKRHSYSSGDDKLANRPVRSISAVSEQTAVVTSSSQPPVVSMCPPPIVSSAGAHANAVSCSVSLAAAASATAAAAAAVGKAACHSDIPVSVQSAPGINSSSVEASTESLTSSGNNVPSAASTEERVVFVPSFGVFRRIKSEPVDCAGDGVEKTTAPLAGNTGNLDPLPPPLTVRLTSNGVTSSARVADNTRGDSSSDSEVPQVVSVGPGERTPPPLVELPDDQTDDWLHLSPSDRRRRRDNDRRRRRRDSSSASRSSSRSSNNNDDGRSRHRRHRHHRYNDDIYDDRRKKRRRDSRDRRRRSRSRGRRRSRDKLMERRRSRSRNDDRRRSRSTSAIRERRDRRASAEDDKRHRRRKRRTQRERCDRRRAAGGSDDSSRERRSSKHGSHRHDTVIGGSPPDTTGVFDYSQVGAGASRRSPQRSHHHRRR